MTGRRAPGPPAGLVSDLGVFGSGLRVRLVLPAPAPTRESPDPNTEFREGVCLPMLCLMMFACTGVPPGPDPKMRGSGVCVQPPGQIRVRHACTAARFTPRPQAGPGAYGPKSWLEEASAVPGDPGLAKPTPAARGPQNPLRDPACVCYPPPPRSEMPNEKRSKVRAVIVSV